MHPSDNPAILFLKLPATILQISPNASHTSGPIWSGSSPSIFEAMMALDFALHLMLITPQSCPASPTIAVTSRGSWEGADAVSWQPNMSSNTSRTAISSTASQHSWTLDFSPSTSFGVFTLLPPEVEGHDPGPARG